MANAEQLETLMGEVAPLVDDVEAVVQTGKNRWDIGFADGEGMMIVCDEELSSLTLVSRIGTIPEENRPLAHEALLRYNGL